MNLAQLKAKGAVIDSAPVRKTITWKHTDEKGDEVTDSFDVWVLRMSFGVIDRLSNAEQSERSRNAELISASVRLGDNADEVMPYDIAYRLHTSLAIELVRAVSEVNRFKLPEESADPKG